MAEILQDQETDLQRYLDFLREPGETNTHLEQTLPENPSFDHSYDISNGRTHCRLDDIPDEEELLYPFEDSPGSPYYVVDTRPAPGKPEKGWKDGRKGHQVRNIGVWNEHGELPPVTETYYEGLNIAERLRDLTFEQIGEGYGVVGGSMQTFEDDLHFVSSDLQTEPGAESDLPGLNNWFLYSVQDGEAEDLIEYRAREKIGAYLEELLL